MYSEFVEKRLRELLNREDVQKFLCTECKGFGRYFTEWSDKAEWHCRDKMS